MYSLRNKSNNLRAFSLLEVSIVIVIIGVLIIGVIGSKHLVKKARLNAAIAITRSSPISGIPNNKLWLESALAEISIGSGFVTGDKIISWLDNSNNKSSIVISAEGTGPIYSNSINSVQAIQFDADSDTNYLKINNASFLNGTDYTIFVVEKRMGTNGSTGNYLLGGETSSFALGYESETSIIQTHGESASTDNQTSIESISDYSNKPRMITAIHSLSAGNKIYVNATLANEDTTSNATTHLSAISELMIGHNYNGEIGEIVIFDRALKAIEVKQVEDYLSDKWDAPNNRDVTATCTSGTITSSGCNPSCVVSINGVSDTIVDTGSSSEFTCNSSSAYDSSDTITYSCDDGVLDITGDATCDCADGYALTSGAGTVCVQGCSVGTIIGSTASGTTVTNGTVVSCDIDGFESATIATCSAPGSISGSCNCAGGASELGGSCVTLNCSGGDTVTEGSVTGMRVHTFSTVGSSTFSCTSPEVVEVLVVAGGGGGGGHSGWDDGGGGGGAGGLIHTSSYSVSSSISVTVGAGGAGGSQTVHEAGHNGEDSVFGTLTALGGGGGGSRNRAGKDGGSGGGSNADGLAGDGTIGQGTDGLAVRGGGGGGAGTAPTSYSGGNGLQYDITGTSTYYAGGGGGKLSSNQGSGGLGGGGDAGSAGTDGTGGGGGAHVVYVAAGFDGGDGIVIVRYYDSNVSAALNTSVTCSVSGITGISDSSSLGYAPSSTALKCDEAGYSGYVTYTCTSSGAATISGSCDPIQCSITGVTGLNDTTTLAYSASSSALTCNEGYDGSPTYTCISDRPAAITGDCTDILCSISGVTGIADVSGLAYSTSAVDLTCEEGFENPPTYTCTATGAATLTGSCSAITCNMTSIEGIEDVSSLAYTVDQVAYDCNSTGYSGQVLYTCTDTGAAVVSGTCFDTTTEPLVCSGGVINDLSGSSGPTTHTFISGDTFSCSDSRNVEVLVVAGGGGGGGHAGWDSGGGGGGAGGLIHSSSYSVSSDITVTVGAGGAGGTSGNPQAPGGNGANSVFGSLTAIGGGGGGARNSDGQDGGSGGGSDADNNSGSGTVGQGHDALASRGSGGGGAGSASTNSNGGLGLEYDISGTSTYYAGGGGGKHSTSGIGGSNSGGDAGYPGVDGTGGGGGAHTISNGPGLDGGNGIVIVRYCVDNLSNPAACVGG